MNKADNEAGSKSIDSLINFETVKVRAIPCLVAHFCVPLPNTVPFLVSPYLIIVPCLVAPLPGGALFSIPGHIDLFLSTKMKFGPIELFWL